MYRIPSEFDFREHSACLPSSPFHEVSGRLVNIAKTMLMLVKRTQPTKKPITKYKDQPIDITHIISVYISHLEQMCINSSTIACKVVQVAEK